MGAAWTPTGLPVALRGRAELLAAAGDDPFVRWDLPARPERAWRLGDAVAVTRLSHRRIAGLSAWVRPPDGRYDRGAVPDAAGRRRLSALLEALLGPGGPERGAVRAVSVPLGCADLLRGLVRLEGGGDWEWMATTREPPPNPAEAALVDLDDAADAAEIAALAVENPLFEGEPGTGRTERWVGARDGAGRLIACGARHRTSGGAAHLSGILVAWSARGRGLGRAVTGALTRESVRDEGVCTLGMYADNAVARRLYHGLGYVTAHAWSSRHLSWESPGYVRAVAPFT